MDYKRFQLQYQTIHHWPMLEQLNRSFEGGQS